MIKTKEESYSLDKENFLLFEVVQESKLIIFSKHIKISDDDKSYQVPRTESKFSVLKKAKQQNNKQAIEHELKMLNLVGKSEAKTPIEINKEIYLPMRFEGELNLLQAITGKEKLSLILECMNKAIQNILTLHKKNIIHMDISLHNLMFPTGELIDFECSLETDEKTGYAELPSYLFGKSSISQQDDFPEACFPFFESGEKTISAVADCFLLADMLSDTIELISKIYKGHPRLPFLKRTFSEIISTILDIDYRANSVELLEEISTGFEFLLETFLKLEAQPSVKLFSKNSVQLAAPFIVPTPGF